MATGSESPLHSTLIRAILLPPEIFTRPRQDVNDSLFVLRLWCNAIRVRTPPELTTHVKSSALYGRSYGRTSKFFRLDGLLLFCIITGLRSASSAKRVCMRIFTTALRSKTIRQILNQNTSPYFHSVSLVIWPLSLTKSTQFSELFISRFSTYIRKAQGWTLHFRTPDLRSEKFQRKMTGRPQIQRRIQAHIL